MGVLGRRAPDPTAPASVRAPIRVLRADGRRIDLTSRDTTKYVAATKQVWQQRAFDYRDLIGELRFAIRLKAQAVARVRFYPAEIRPWPQDPVPIDSPGCTLDPQLVADIQANFGRLPFDSSPDGFTSRLDENLSIAGEVWIHIDAEDTITVRSVSEIGSGTSGQLTLNALPGGTASGQRIVDPETEELLRLWTAHPEWAELADSPMRPVQDVAEDVVLAGREQRAAARSRIAANGLLLIPNELSMLKTRDEDSDDGIDTDTFLEDLVAAFMAPITSNDEDVHQVVPIVLRGDAEDLDKVRQVTISRADSEQLVARQNAGLLRLLKSLDVQPEQVEGVGGMNHWGAYVVDSRAIKQQVQPSAETIAACLVQAFLAPALLSLDHDRAEVKRVTIAVDPSELAENPDRGQDARDAYDRSAISAEALRRELGFDEEDKPDDDEALRRLATSGALPVGVTAALLGLSQQDTKVAATIEAQVSPDDTTTKAPALPAGKAPTTAPSQVVPSTPDPTPAGPPTTGPVVAAGHPELLLRVDIGASHRLADIDAALTDRILVAADAALHRVLERAGARVRNAEQRAHGKAMAARLTGLDAHLVAAALGREQVEAVASVHDLLADSYSRLHTQVSGWLGSAAEQTADATVALLGLDVDDEHGALVHKTVVARLGTSADRAWPVLADALDAAAETALFDPDPNTNLLPVQDVADALAAAGGDTLTSLTAAGRQSNRRKGNRRPRSTPGAGYATGPVVGQVIANQGGILLGHEWRYHPELHRDTFTPHHRLNGIRFTSWDDPQLDTSGEADWVGPFFRPQDHQGCVCGTAVVYATPSDPESDTARVLREAAGEPRKIGATHADLRDRITAAADAMRDMHINAPRRKR